jgi:hypothetical protein
LTSPIYAWIKARVIRIEVLVVILWGIAITALLAHDLFQGSLPSTLDFGILFAFGLMAGALLADLQKALFGFLAATWIGAILMFILATIPAFTGIVQPPGDQAVYTVWFTLMFRALFPVPFVISLFASLIGAGIGETYL